MKPPLDLDRLLAAFGRPVVVLEVNLETHAADRIPEEVAFLEALDPVALRTYGDLEPEASGDAGGAP